MCPAIPARPAGPLPTQGREYNSGGGHYVGSPLGGGSGMGSHGPSQVRCGVVLVGQGGATHAVRCSAGASRQLC